jgi:conjugative relaxase-like TrwC/TraI family protein
MVSISKPQKMSQAKGYLEKENYYQKNSELGYFYGLGCKHIGLENGTAVDKETYHNLLSGCDAKGNELLKNAGDKERRAGLDVTFSAPKSVSILMEYYEANNDKKADKLRAAHAKAVAYAMKTLQSKYSKTRIYDSDKKRIKVDAKMVYASFEHDISRQIKDEIDPQLHTHNFIFNTVFYEDERTREVKSLALSNEEIYQNKMYLGQLYRNELAKNLTDAGYKLESTNRSLGFFDIEGFTQKQLDEFSGRSQQIKNVIEQYREKYPNLDDEKLKEIIVERVAKF